MSTWFDTADRMKANPFCIGSHHAHDHHPHTAGCDRDPKCEPAEAELCVNCGTPVSRVEPDNDEWWEHDEECPEDTPCYDGNSKWVGPEWAYEKLRRRHG